MDPEMGSFFVTKLKKDWFYGDLWPTQRVGHENFKSAIIETSVEKASAVEINLNCPRWPLGRWDA